MTKKLRIQYAVYIFCMFLAVIFFVANIVVTQEQFLYNTVCSVLGTERRVLVDGDPSQYTYYRSDYPDKAKTLAAANALNERIVEEGIVLLKNDGLLPITTPVSDAAGDKRDEPAMGSSLLTGIFTGETAVSSYPDSVKNSYKNYNDAAFVVLSLGGEGFDLPRTSKTSLNSSGKIIKGARSETDHYLQLDKNEVDMIREAMDNFADVVIIINSSEAMELGFLDDPSHYLYTDDGYADSVKATACMNKLKAAV